MKRTIALKMVVLAPAAVVLLVFFMAANAPFSAIKRGGAGREWAGLMQLTLIFWAALMLPLFIALEAALIAGLDHSENQWKALFARPVPRWTWYVAKLIVIVTMVIGSTVVLLCGTLLAGAILPKLQPELVFGFPVPWVALFQQTAQITALAFLAVTIQHWVSMRWRSFSIGIGVGIVATVVGYVAAMTTFRTPDWPQYFPWSLPMLVLSRHPQNVPGALWTGIAVGLGVATAGCFQFCRREVS
jgi:hypothetical protein